MNEQLNTARQNELIGKVNINWRISLTFVLKIVFSLTIAITIVLTIAWKFEIIQFCGNVFGGTVICGPNQSKSNNGLTPTTTPTPAPPISITWRSRGICEITTFITSETDKAKITVTSIVVEQTNVDLDHLTINFIAENLTNKPLTLKVDSNVSIFETGQSDIVAAPELEMSTSPIEMAAKGKQVARLSIDRIYDKISNIDIVFRHLIMDETPIDEETPVIGIPVSCGG